MKFLTQVVVPIAIVIGVIVVLTFVSHYVGSGPKSTDRILATGKELDPAQEFPLQPLAGGNWRDQLLEPLTAETQREGQHLFWFHNTLPEPVELRLVSLNEACIRVDMLVLTESEVRAFSRQSTSALAGLIGDGNGALSMAGGLAVLDAAFRQALPQRWQRVLFPAEGKPAMVPPLAVGAERLVWKVERPTNVLVSAEINARGVMQLLGVPLSFVPALQVSTPVVRLPELTRAGQQESGEFVCWSSTRSSFPLEVRNVPADPCITCSAEPLNPAELQLLAKARQVEVRAGYRVRITVAERRSEEQLLELGPLARTVVLVGPKDAPPAVVFLSGFVRGPVRVGADDQELNLGSFATKRGVSRTIVLAADSPDLKLAIDSRVPGFLEAALAPLGSGRWELQVRVPAGAAFGRLPADSAVFVKLMGKTQRRLRIPVSGQGTQ